MIKLYTRPSCNTCMKTKTWLEYHEFPYVERNFFEEPFHEEEVAQLMELCENGIGDLLIEYTQDHEDIITNINQLPCEEVTALLNKYPRFLKRPILVWNDHIMIGYDEIEIHHLFFSS